MVVFADPAGFRTGRRGFRRTGSRWLLPVVVISLALAGCAAIPTTDRVHEVQNIRGDEHLEPYVRVFPLLPRGGEGPTEIVRGFLQASSSDEPGYPTARAYLAPRVADGWDPGARAVVYDQHQTPPLSAAARNTVVLSASHVGTVDAEGKYEPADRGSITATFRLTKVDGEWRIADLPDGLYVSLFDFQRVYRSVSLYFFDPEQRVLVPDPIYLPARSGLAAQVGRRLLRGPTSWLAPAVTTAFPDDASLSRPSIPVEDGVAHVRLSEAVLGASPERRDLMVAQLVWTLGEMPNVSSVRITAKGEEFPISGDQAYQSTPMWKQYDPASSSVPPVGYFQRDGRLYTMARAEPERAPGPFGEGAVPMRAFAVSPGSEVAAGVSADGTTLHVGGIEEDARLQARLEGTSLTSPSWDGRGNLWVVDQGDEAQVGARVWRLSQGAQPQEVSVERLAGDSRILALRVASDGTRVALVVERQGRSSVLLGRVVPAGGGEVAIDGLRTVARRLVEVRDVAWHGSERLAVLGRDAQGPLQPYLVDTDGSQLTPAGSLAGLEHLAAATDQPLIVGTKEGLIWQQSRGSGWTKIDPGHSPVYPG
ncbi:MAG: LpqB family beta-propeller domain-containing protein [Streptomycetales bacterium]